MNKQNKEQEPVENHQPKIMTKPLPEILDDLENYIMRVEEAVRQAKEAAKESRQAAAEARDAGEKAAEAAKKAAEAAVAEVRKEAAKAINDLDRKLDSEIISLRDQAIEEAAALDRAFLALQEKHLEDSPFLRK